MYRHVLLGSRQIRIVEILPGPPSANLKLKIKPVNLDDGTYEALSYTWGGHLMLRRIIEANGCHILVPDSAFRALKSLRYTDKERISTVLLVI